LVAPSAFPCRHSAKMCETFPTLSPFLSDPDDDMILELAFAAGCRYIVTHNTRHFLGCQQLGIEAVMPGDFLAIVNKTFKP